KEQVDALITIPNQKLLDLEEKNLPIQDAFALADSILSQGVKGISDLIVQPGLINVDFADVKTIMQNAGTALMGIGRADGESRAEVAAEQAINSPLLDINIKGATGILLNIVGPDLTLAEVETISTKVAQEAGEGAHIIIGANPSKGDKSKTLSVTVIATGFDSPYSSDYDIGDFNFTPTPLKKASPSETPSSKPSFEKDSSSLETVTDPDAEEPLESPEDSSDDKKGDDDPWKLPTFLRRG
ncbi:MAG TPA: cell division protein FtsZ, partial [candidate division WWE3 bacterium]|nr:cell division protein FtsZ [candidate division WWE3 bacterium]